MTSNSSLWYARVSVVLPLLLGGIAYVLNDVQRGRPRLAGGHPFQFYGHRGCSLRTLCRGRSRGSLETPAVRLRVVCGTGAPGVCSFLHPVAA